MSDRILIINEGKIVADGSPESLRKASGEGLTIRVKVDTETSPEAVIERTKINFGRKCSRFIQR
jgi:ABC-type multidrug transport system ATPase subunit